MRTGRWGVSVLAALALSIVTVVVLGSKTKEFNYRMVNMEPPAQPVVSWVLTRGDAAPQAFHVLEDVASAKLFVAETNRAHALDAAFAFHTRDLWFMAAYTLLLVLGAIWSWKRAGLLLIPPISAEYGWFGRIAQILAPIAGVAALAGVAGDLYEHRLCVRMLQGEIDGAALASVRFAYHLKWWGVGIAAFGGLFAGAIAALMTPPVRTWVLEKWELVVSAHRFAMRARFSILGAGLYTLLLLTGPGKDIIRSVATGAFSGEEVAKSRPDFAHLGWLSVALVILALTCWGWARLVLAISLSVPGERGSTHADSAVERRLRRDLPIYYGAMPLAATACAFSVAPLQELGKEPIAQVFAASAAPLLLFFVLPLLLVAFRRSDAAPRRSFGPLSWTLSIYAGLALVHAWFTFKDIGVLALVPCMLFLVALVVFGLGRPAGLFVLPALLMVAALFHGMDKVFEALIPALVMVGFAALTCWASATTAGVDNLHIPRRIRTGTFLRLAFGSSTLLQVPRRKPRLLRLRGLLQWCALLTVFQVVLFVLVLLSPQQFSMRMGSAAILCLGLAAWAVAGSVLLFLTQSSRFPILGASLVVAVICSGMMDNHGIRISGPMPPELARAREVSAAETKQSGPMATSFQRWLNQGGTTKKSHCVIVAAEGGGIRAAFWPAIVLSTLQENSLTQAPGQPDFASHVFAMSGVSGGSVGLGVFDALCAQDRHGKLRELAARLCGEDHLAPTLAALMYPDFVQRFLPLAVFPKDRASAFEGSWERVWKSTCGSNRMGEPFLSLWKEGDRPVAAAESRWLPCLFLNSTMVETGKRVICSNIPVRTGGDGTFVDAHDLHAHLRSHGAGAGEWQDLPLSAAAHTSARFPLVSPPGRLPSGARVVDGGYFENSAAATGFDLLQAVMQQRDRLQPDLPLIFIFFRYASAPGLTDVPPTAAKRPSSVPASDAISSPKTNLLNETLSIVGTLFKTRDARAAYSQDAIATRYFVADNLTVISFTFSGEEIPLSWSLSQTSCKEILRQFPKDLNADGRADIITKANAEASRALMKALYGSEP